MNLKQITLYLTLGLLLFTPKARSEDPDWMSQTALAPTAGEGEMLWKNQFTSYGDNTEFFEPFRIRETLLGQQFESYMDASITPHVDLWGGGYVDHPSAQEVETDIQPILSFVYHSGGSQFIFGTLQTSLSAWID